MCVACEQVKKLKTSLNEWFKTIIVPGLCLAAWKRTFYAPNMSSTVRPSYKHKTGLPVQIKIVQIVRLFFIQHFTRIRNGCTHLRQENRSSRKGSVWNMNFFFTLHTDKKENEIFLINKEIQMESVAKSYMGKGFLIYEETRKYLTIEEAVTHIWLCNRSLQNFPIYVKKIDFFYQCRYTWIIIEAFMN